MRRFGHLSQNTSNVIGWTVALAVAPCLCGVAWAQRREGNATTAAAASLPNAQPGDVQLPGLETNTLPPGGEQTTDLGLVEQAVPRLEASVIAQCGDRAHKSRWETDNPRFEKCVCPQVSKWHLPKVGQELRVQRALAKGRNGYSFTADVNGRAQNCRVWSGMAAPSDDTVAWRGTAAKPTEKKRQ